MPAVSVPDKGSDDDDDNGTTDTVVVDAVAASNDGSSLAGPLASDGSSLVGLSDGSCLAGGLAFNGSTLAGGLAFDGSSLAGGLASAAKADWPSKCESVLSSLVKISPSNLGTLQSTCNVTQYFYKMLYYLSQANHQTVCHHSNSQWRQKTWQLLGVLTVEFDSW